MAATKLQMNWSAVSFAATPITKVNSVQVSNGGSLESYSADADQYPTVILHSMSKPRVSLTSGDIGNLRGFAEGATGTFLATHKDAKLQTGGDLLYTVINAVIENIEGSGSHAQIGSGTMTMLAYSADGITPPISIARA
jgi:hypothetical protein